MDGKRTTVYAIIALCIAGIALVGFLIFKYLPANEGFSELYFENHEQLPDKIRVGEEENFAFTVVSREVDKSSYRYAVKFDDKTIKEGTFTLSPQEERTIDMKFTAVESSIAFVDSKTESYATHFELDNIVGISWPGSKTEEPVPAPGIEDNHVILPINFLFDGTPGSTLLLRVNPGSKDSFHFSSRRKYDVKGKGEETKTGDTSPLALAGYDLVEEEQTITNDHGRITFTRKVVKSEYRYQKRKVSVELAANGKEYEIHFWVTVEQSTVEPLGKID